jgi:DedD protein
MEKKKLLLVSVSVGLFLVIVIGASILVFSPRDYPSVTKSEIVPISPGMPQAAVGVPPVETAPPSAPEIAIEQPAPGDTVPPANEQRTLGNVIYINGDNAENAVRVERLNDGNTTTYINIPSPRENIITVTTPQVPQSAPPAAYVETPAAAPAKSVAAKPETPVSAQKSGAALVSSGTNVEKAASKPAWWVQANSYSRKAYADNAKKFLETKGITSVITDGVIGGKTFYRVRVGPYSSKTEADYWLSLIKTIEGMENSLVWQSSSL